MHCRPKFFLPQNFTKHVFLLTRGHKQSDYLISKEEMELILLEFDDFSFGKKIQVSGKEFGQTCSIKSIDYFSNFNTRVLIIQNS